jgi:hypothetical protein
MEKVVRVTPWPRFTPGKREKIQEYPLVRRLAGLDAREII